MKQNIRIAKQLVMIAKEIVAGRQMQEDGVWHKDVQHVVKSLCDDPEVTYVKLALSMSVDQGDGSLDDISSSVDIKGGFGDYSHGNIMDYVLDECGDGVEDVRIDKIQYKKRGEGELLHEIPVSD